MIVHVCNVLSNRFYFGSVYLAKNIFILENIGPARAGLAGPVATPLHCSLLTAHWRSFPTVMLTYI